MKNFPYIIAFLILVLSSCSDDSRFDDLADVDEHECTDLCILDEDEIHNNNSKVWEENGKTYLYGGRDQNMHFDATPWDFVTQNLHFGLGRETIEALIEPQFTVITNADQFPKDDRCVVIETDDGVKIYPLAILRRHEVVNDVIDGQPVFIGYCLLAEYVSVLSRTYCGQELTFGVSGWTYAEDGVWDGLQGFVLWDRDTESLWWPLINKGVTGVMNGVELSEYNPTKWEIAPWGETIQRYPEAKILNAQQTHKIPTSWEIINPEQLNCQ